MLSHQTRWETGDQVVQHHCELRAVVKAQHGLEHLLRPAHPDGRQLPPHGRGVQVHVAVEGQVGVPQVLLECGTLPLPTGEVPVLEALEPVGEGDVVCEHFHGFA